MFFVNFDKNSGFGNFSISLAIIILAIIFMCLLVHSVIILKQMKGML
ncbi:hypothetical protein [Campylobacter sputorum]|nr:hypothetical protein [Campylobacter sputorum]